MTWSALDKPKQVFNYCHTRSSDDAVPRPASSCSHSTSQNVDEPRDWIDQCFTDQCADHMHGDNFDQGPEQDYLNQRVHWNRDSKRFDAKN